MRKSFMTTSTEEGVNAVKNAKLIVKRWEEAINSRSDRSSSNHGDRKPRLFNIVPLMPPLTAVQICADEFRCFSDKKSILQALNESPAITSPILTEFSRKNLEDLIQLRMISKPYSSIEPIISTILRNSLAPPSLKLEKISWEKSCAATIEFVGRHDRVRPVKDWRVLKGRLSSEGGQRCYGIFHDSIPNKPICFVFVSLTKGIAHSISDLATPHPSDSFLPFDTCMFYSINSPFPGLHGIDFGNTLIKNVAYKLKHEEKQLRAFATLSPIPGFRNWLLQNHVEFSQLSINQLSNEIQSRLMELCRKYLSSDETRDAVACFHYRNGAKLLQVNAGADEHSKGWQDSYGFMANYIYNLE